MTLSEMRTLTFISPIGLSIGRGNKSDLDISEIILQDTNKLMTFNNSLQGLDGDCVVKFVLQLAEVILESIDGVDSVT
jgi:hypothetical protein